MKVAHESAQNTTNGRVLKLKAQLRLLLKTISADLEVSTRLRNLFLVIIRTRPLLQSEELEAKGRIYCIKQH